MKLGLTKVKVMRVEINEQTGRQSVQNVREGVIMQDFGSFVRVFNPDPVSKGGDPSPEVAEIFPVRSPRCWIEILGELKYALPIPAVFK